MDSFQISTVKQVLIEFRKRYAYFYDVSHLTKIAKSLLYPLEKNKLNKFLTLDDENECRFRPKINNYYGK